MRKVQYIIEMSNNLAIEFVAHSCSGFIWVRFEITHVFLGRTKNRLFVSQPSAFPLGGNTKSPQLLLS